ncbi:MAG: hypothetical protein LQ344_003655 [Seirophora lacunosa]|nr:MAG: hypothetical protein LQ344_003655 [Seirophora lacunosa]
MSGRGRTLVKAICGLVGATSVVPQVGFNVDPIVFAPVEDALMDILTPQDGGVGSDILLFLGAAAEQAASVSKSLFQSALRTNWWPLLFVLLLVCCGLALAYAASVKAMWKDLSARVALVRAELLLVRSVRDALRNELDRRTLEITHVTRKFMRLEPALEKARDDGALARTNLGLYQALVQQQDQEIQRLEADATDSANAIVTRDEAIRQLQCEIARLTAEHRAEVLPPSEPSAAVAKSEAPASASLDLLPHQSPGLDVPAPSAAQSAPEPESLVTGSNAPSGTHDQGSDQSPAVSSSSGVPSTGPKLPAQPAASVAAWKLFSATVPGKEAAEQEQQQAERAARQAEEKRTGIQQNVSLPPMRETFRQVTIGANDERQITSTAKRVTGPIPPASQPSDASPVPPATAGKPTAEVYVPPSMRHASTSPMLEPEADGPETHTDEEAPIRKKKQNRRKNLRRRNNRLKAEQAGEAASEVPAEEQEE